MVNVREANPIIDSVGKPSTSDDTVCKSPDDVIANTSAGSSELSEQHEMQNVETDSTAEMIEPEACKAAVSNAVNDDIKDIQETVQTESNDQVMSGDTPADKNVCVETENIESMQVEDEKVLGKTTENPSDTSSNSTDIATEKENSAIVKEGNVDPGTENGLDFHMDYRSKKSDAAADDSSDTEDSSSDSDDTDSKEESDKKAEDDHDSASQKIDKAFSTRDQSPETERRIKLNRHGFEDLRTKGELLPEELPPLEELTITVDETVEMTKVGTVKSIVGILVVIQTCENVPPLNDDTILFLEGRTVLGQVFEVFGPVQAPWYSVRFNKEENIKSKGIAVGQPVYCAPKEDSFTTYVFVDSLKQLKGSDASWEDNNEPPEKYIEYSDDETEQAAKSRKKKKKKPANAADPSETGDCLPQEKRSRNQPRHNDQSQHGGNWRSNQQQPGSYRPRNPFQGSNGFDRDRPRHPGGYNPRHANNGPRNLRWGPPQGNRQGNQMPSFGGQPRFQPQVNQNNDYQFGQNNSNQGNNMPRPNFQAGGNFGCNQRQPFYGNTMPGSNNVGPGSNFAGPGPNNAGPGGNFSGPGPNNVGPSANFAGPGPNNAGSGSNFTGPGMNNAGQGSNFAGPGPNNAGPSMVPPPTGQNQSGPPWQQNRQQNNATFWTGIAPPSFNNMSSTCNNPFRNNQTRSPGQMSAPGQLPPNQNQGMPGAQNMAPNQPGGNTNSQQPFQFQGNTSAPQNVNNSFSQNVAQNNSFPPNVTNNQFGNGPSQQPPGNAFRQGMAPGGSFGNNSNQQSQPQSVNSQPPNNNFQGPGNNFQGPGNNFQGPGNNFQGSGNNFQGPSNNTQGQHQNMFQGNNNQAPAGSNQTNPSCFQNVSNFPQQGNRPQQAPTVNRMQIHALNPGLQSNTQTRPVARAYEEVNVGGSNMKPYRPEIGQQNNTMGSGPQGGGPMNGPGAFNAGSVNNSVNRAEPQTFPGGSYQNGNWK